MSFKMAIIGYGGMGGHHHENLKKWNMGIDVVGAYDIRPERAEVMQKNGIQAYASPEEIYNDKSIDLVLVATPNDTHKPYSIACLEAGKNVICEKPVMLSVADLEDVYAAAEKAGKFFTVHQNRRFDTDYLTLRNIIDLKILNKPFVIESRVQGSRQYLVGWRAYKPNGGGMLLDWGVHLVDQMLQMIPGKVVSVMTHMHKQFNEVDDSFTTMFRFDNGVSYLVNITMNCFITQPRWHACFEDGTVMMGGPDNQHNWDGVGEIVRLKPDAENLGFEEVITYTAAGPTRTMSPRPHETVIRMSTPVVVGQWQDYYKNILACLQGKAAPLVTKDEAIRLLRVIELMIRSGETGEMIRCDL